MDYDYDLSFDARLKRLLKEWDAEVSIYMESPRDPEIYVKLREIRDDEGSIIRDCQTFSLGPIVRGDE